MLPILRNCTGGGSGTPPVPVPPSRHLLLVIGLSSIQSFAACETKVTNLETDKIPLRSSSHDLKRIKDIDLIFVDYDDDFIIPERDYDKQALIQHLQQQSWHAKVQPKNPPPIIPHWRIKVRTSGEVGFQIDGYYPDIPIWFEPNSGQYLDSDYFGKLEQQLIDNKSVVADAIRESRRLFGRFEKQ